jgi:arylsulfatase A-like enzyme
MQYFKFSAYLIFQLLFFSCQNQQHVETAKETPPNVLFIAVDDLNDWLGCMGGHPHAITPNMDKLAAHGVLFTNAHCQAPLCGPSRASLMTGLRPSTTGIYGMIKDNEIRSDNKITEDIIFLPEYFKQNSYHTMGVGKLFHDHAPDGVFDESPGRYAGEAPNHGFGPIPDNRFVWEGLAPENTEIYGRTSTDWGAFPEQDSLMPDYKAVQWAKKQLQKDYGEQPFFLAVGFLRPHVPLYVPSKWFELHPVEELAMPPYKADDLQDVPAIAREKINDLPMMPSTEWAIETGKWADIVQAYLACVSFVDHQVGQLIQALEESGYADNTVIVLWSDHGYRVGEKGTFAKHCLWEEATNAPLIFSGVGIPRGKVIDDPVEMLSVYPTLLEACNLPAYSRNEGQSLLSLMNGEATSQQLKAITTFGMNNHSVKANNFRYIQYEDRTEELYNHKLDSNEFNNVIGEQKYRDEREQLRQMLPDSNAYWHPHSSYTFQPYFVEQKERTNAMRDKSTSGFNMK